MDPKPTQEEEKWESFAFVPDKNPGVHVHPPSLTPKQNSQDQSPPHMKKKKSQTKYEELQAKVDQEIKDKWEIEQNALKQNLKEYDDFNWTLNAYDPSQTPLSLIGAIDISYSKTDDKKAVAALIISEYPSLKVIYEDYEKETADYPYVPGFLAFKEIPVYTVLFERLK